MARVSLDLDDKADLQLLGASGWRRSMGMVPGEPNQGLVAEMRGVAARMPDYDDSGWEQPATIQERLSVGFTFAWYRLAFTMPETVKGQTVGGNRVFFECNVDNYGEVYIDGAIDRNIGVITGNNTPKRVSPGRCRRAGEAARGSRAGGQRSPGGPGGRDILPPRHPGL